MTVLNETQILNKVFDSATGTLKTSSSSGGGSADSSAANQMLEIQELQALNLKLSNRIADLLTKVTSMEQILNTHQNDIADLSTTVLSSIPVQIKATNGDSIDLQNTRVPIMSAKQVEPAEYDKVTINTYTEINGQDYPKQIFYFLNGTLVGTVDNTYHVSANGVVLLEESIGT